MFTSKRRNRMHFGVINAWKRNTRVRTQQSPILYGSFFHSSYFVTIKLVEIIALVLFLSCKRFIFLICSVSLNARIYCIGLYWWLNMIYEWAHFACIYFEEFFKIGCYGWWMRLEFMCATSALQTSMWKQYMFSLFVFFVFRFYFVAFVVIWMWTFYNELLLPFIRWVNFF